MPASDYTRERQRQVMAELIENVKSGKKVSMGRILKKYGYSDSVSLAPTKVTRTQTWQALLDERLSEDKLSEVHADILGKVDKNGQPHSDALKAVELGYRLRNKLTSTPDAGVIAFQININQSEDKDTDKDNLAKPDCDDRVIEGEQIQ